MLEAMIYTVICRAALDPSTVAHLGARGLDLETEALATETASRRHSVLIEAATTAGARATAADALRASGVEEYDLEVRAGPRVPA